MNRSLGIFVIAIGTSLQLCAMKDLCYIDHEGAHYSKLYEAIKNHKSIPTIEKILLKGLNPYCVYRNTRGTMFSAIEIATIEKDIPTIDFLINWGCDIEWGRLFSDRTGETPLVTALLQTKDLDFIDYFLSQGADLEEVCIFYSGDICSALKLAINNQSSLAIIKHIVKKGANLEKVYSCTKGIRHSALCEAIRSNSDVIVLDYLISQGADLTSVRQNSNGDIITALGESLRSKPDDLKLIDYFLSKGSTLTCCCKCADGDMLPALTLAILHHPQAFKLIDYLISRGADLEDGFTMSSGDHRSVLGLAISNEFDLKLIDYLICKGAHLESCYTFAHGETAGALVQAILLGNFSLVKLLIEHGADILKSYRSKTYYQLAKERGYEHVARYIKAAIAYIKEGRFSKNVVPITYFCLATLQQNVDDMRSLFKKIKRYATGKKELSSLLYVTHLQKKNVAFYELLWLLRPTPDHLMIHNRSIGEYAFKNLLFDLSRRSQKSLNDTIFTFTRDK